MSFLDALGVSYVEVVELLETEGLDKFDASWAELVEEEVGVARWLVGRIDPREVLDLAGAGAAVEAFRIASLGDL